MFSKRSRYKNVADTAGIDVVGEDGRVRTVEYKSLRRLPEVEGTFRHTVEESDRLDHLGYKYYKQPVKWWRICDANPDYLSPLGLLGKEPIETVCFTIGCKSGGAGSFNLLLNRLAEEPGIVDAGLEHRAEPCVKEVQHVPEPETEAVTEAVTVTVNSETTTTLLTVVYNRLTVSLPQLLDLIDPAHFSIETPTPVSRVGKQIVIPPDSVS